MSVQSRAPRRFPIQFCRDEDGALTVESVLWIPFYIIMLSLTVDASAMMHGSAKAMRIAQDVNRQASTGYYITEDELEAMTTAALAHFSPNATVESVIGLTAVSTTITIPSSDLEVIGFFGNFKNFDVSVATIHLLEL